MLGERERHCRGKPELPEVVTICNHLVALGATELEHKILRESLRVAFDLLIQALGGHAVKRREIGVEHDLLVADDQNLLGDTRSNEEPRRFVLGGDTSVLHIGRNGPDGW